VIVRRVNGIRALPIAVGIVAISACSQHGNTRRDADSIDLKQSVTAERDTQDPAFIDFEQNWRVFISNSPELALPVVPVPGSPDQSWDPIVVAECVFSPEAKGLVPQVTLTWNDGVADQSIRRRPRGSEAGPVRIDLAVHFNGFVRNYYSSVLSTAALDRFKLPSSSALIADSEAVMLTGPALFAKLMRFSVETIEDRDKGRQLQRHTLVIRDLSQGLTYKMRLSNLADGAWHEDRQYVFLTPVCPNSF
jgi:hypothetical protein